MPKLEIPALFNLEKAEHAALIHSATQPWLALALLPAYVEQLLRGPYKPALHSPVPQGAWFGPDVYLGPNCEVEPGVYVKGPAWIGEGCILRHGLYCKEYVLAERGVFLGHASELKNCYLLPAAQVSHFNYVGDSILGTGAHLGAGVILSNFRLDERTVPIRFSSGLIDSGLKKLGGIIGDACQIGCNSVVNPGTILGRKTIVYPQCRIQGVYDEGSIYKGR